MKRKKEKRGIWTNRFSTITGIKDSTLTSLVRFIDLFLTTDKCIYVDAFFSFSMDIVWYMYCLDIEENLKRLISRRLQLNIVTFELNKCAIYTEFLVITYQFSFYKNKHVNGEAVYTHFFCPGIHICYVASEKTQKRILIKTNQKQNRYETKVRTSSNQPYVYFSSFLFSLLFSFSFMKQYCL